MKYTLVNFDDWQVLYDEDGQKVLEADVIPVSAFVRFLGGTVKFTSQIFEIEVENNQKTPEHLGDYPDYAFTS